MFLNTLCIGEWSVLNWVSTNIHNHADDNSDMEVNDQTIVIQDEVTASTRKKKLDQEKKDLIQQFFDSLPKLESHYCRKDSQKLYLEPQWQSKAELFRLYESFCESKGKLHLRPSIFNFYAVFDDSNIGLFQPKKDQCDICCSFKQGNLDQETYNAHIERKNEARKEKDTYKANAKSENSKTAVFTMDTQAVLLSPMLNASALYYRTKLKVHNFTLFNLVTLQGYCYLWDETEGGLNADEFTSIISKFIRTEVDGTKYDHIIMYSDGCTFQNRNAILSNALLQVSHQTGFTITQKFLEKGHTQMECDSMHATIEKRLKNREVYSPSGYVEACRTARKHPEPYQVQYLYHESFLKYSDLKFISSIRPGTKKGDPVVTNLKVIKYEPNWSITVKLNFSDEFLELPRAVNIPRGDVHLVSLYDSTILLEERKFKDLQEMKVVLPRDVHPYYDSLPHYKGKYGKKVCHEGNGCSCIVVVESNV